ncbi:MAG TPA: hypothetical protein VIW64_06160 [Pyrinomonadaceae bacterium]
MTSFTGFCFSGGNAPGDLGARRFDEAEVPEPDVEPADVEPGEGAGMLSGVADAELA